MPVERGAAQAVRPAVPVLYSVGAASAQALPPAQRGLSGYIPRIRCS